MNLYELVNHALERDAAPGITGWGLDNPDPALFDAEEVGPAYGCDSDTCHCNSHGSSAPDVKLIPKRGTLVFLGEEGHDSWTKYFALVEAPTVLAFVEVSGDRAYHDTARCVERVPLWALKNLAA
jgi:hypothetical protein